MNNFLAYAQRDLPRFGWVYELNEYTDTIDAQNIRSGIKIIISEDGAGIRIWKQFYLYNSARENKQMLLATINDLNNKCSGIRFSLHVDNKGTNTINLSINHPFEYNRTSFEAVLKTWEHDYKEILALADDLNPFLHKITKIEFEGFNLITE